jgi:hypothetical protein
MFNVRTALLLDEDNRRRSEFAAEQGIGEEAALEAGLKEKAKEFVETGSEVYAKA